MRERERERKRERERETEIEQKRAIQERETHTERGRDLVGLGAAKKLLGDLRGLPGRVLQVMSTGAPRS